MHYRSVETDAAPEPEVPEVFGERVEPFFVTQPNAIGSCLADRTTNRTMKTRAPFRVCRIRVFSCGSRSVFVTCRLGPCGRCRTSNGSLGARRPGIVSALPSFGDGCPVDRSPLRASPHLPECRIGRFRLKLLLNVANLNEFGSRRYPAKQDRPPRRKARKLAKKRTESVRHEALRHRILEKRTPETLHLPPDC